MVFIEKRRIIEIVMAVLRQPIGMYLIKKFSQLWLFGGVVTQRYLMKWKQTICGIERVIFFQRKVHPFQIS
ncbi:hypothetical protein DSJ_08895 [Pantoea stewartii subsp. stewartii DC283]|uniref:Transposase n=1 Tax=Pantoea stewartii subsp. stewartii DC283 TaxID=660596 RepID=A0ABN4YZ73_PANSE|nr:hypothetical protein DSJ_08895 [Pantoea stewartii subsp. stewartii DC283]